MMLAKKPEFHMNFGKMYDAYLVRDVTYRKSANHTVKFEEDVFVRVSPESNIAFIGNRYIVQLHKLDYAIVC
jgi:hypothetical protein